MSLVLNDLLEAVSDVEVMGDSRVPISELQFDSRKVRSGDVYFAAKGTLVDGHKFIDGAIEKGAKAIICEDLPHNPIKGVTYVRVPNTRLALGIMANCFYGAPSQKLTLIGITGTNGKTTIATLLYNIFSELGYRCGLLSTIRNLVNGKEIPSTHTTGDALQICQLMALMIDADCQYCFMEVTSHAIDQHRIAGLKFDAGLFTNLSHDHLDYHKTMESYRDTKKLFFDNLGADTFCLTNIDDPVGSYMVEGSRARCLSYSHLGSADYALDVKELTGSGIKMSINGVNVEAPMVGEFNAYNLAATFGTAVELGIPENDIVRRIREIEGVEGRMQPVPSSANISAIVDFAHTPDGLQKAAEALRQLTPRDAEFIIVIGCGGDRDQDKRAEMGRIAAEIASTAIFTSDNPRSEKPESIIQQMLDGTSHELKSGIIVEPDRRKAISLAVSNRPANSVILVAGKGHEKFQDIQGVKLEFDDVEVLREALEELAKDDL